jgi:hypothetical protein
MTKTTTILAVFALLTVSACAASGADLVRKDRAGGRVALQGGYMPAMADARQLMVDHCGGRFDMLELGDSVEFRCHRGAEQTAKI